MVDPFSDDAACSPAYIVKMTVDMMSQMMAVAVHQLVVEYAKTVVAHNAAPT